jgi:hypothetical protein
MSWSHRLATLESSPSYATVIPINTSSRNNTSRSSLFERGLAKYRSLPLLWLRPCSSSNQQQRQRTTTGNIGKNTISTSFGYFGEFENTYNLLFAFSFLFICINLFHTQKKCRELFVKHFRFFK